MGLLSASGFGRLLEVLDMVQLKALREEYGSGMHGSVLCMVCTG